MIFLILNLVIFQKGNFLEKTFFLADNLPQGSGQWKAHTELRTEGRWVQGEALLTDEGVSHHFPTEALSRGERRTHRAGADW